MISTLTLKDIRATAYGPSEIQRSVVTFEEEPDEFLIYGSIQDAIPLIGQKVEIDSEEELVDNVIWKVIRTITEYSVITVKDRNINGKLYCDNIPQTRSTVSFDDVKEDNGFFRDCIVYCSKHVFESSSKATWVKLTILDINRKSSTVRLFDPDRSTADLQGHYIRCDLRVNKFGFITQEVEALNFDPITANPELHLAKQYLIGAIEEDATLSKVVASINLIDELAKFNDEDGLEAGSEVIRLAREVDVALSLRNVTNSLNINLIRRALVASRFFVCNNNNPFLSRGLRNIMIVANSELNTDRELLVLLDEANEISLAERGAISNIRSLVDTIMQSDNTYNFSKLDKKTGRFK